MTDLLHLLAKKAVLLQKMALEDIRVGDEDETKANPAWDTKVYDYTHALNDRAPGYHIELHDQILNPDEKYLTAKLFHGREEVGSVSGSIEAGQLGIGLASIDKDHRAKRLGLGQGMYTAIFAHALNHHGTKTCHHDIHSSMSARCISKLAAIHGFDYRPMPSGVEQPTENGAFDDAIAATDHSLTSNSNSEEELKKGLTSSLAGIAAAAALSAASPTPALQHAAQASVQVARKWSPTGIHQELLPIAHLESNFGKYMDHAPNKQGSYYSAHGAVGLKVITAHEEWKRNKDMKTKFPGLEEPANFEAAFKTNPTLYNALASKHWTRIRKAVGSPSKAAYAWRFGLTAAKRASDSVIDEAPYVKNFNKLLAEQHAVAFNKPIKKSEFTIEEPLDFEHYSRVKGIKELDPKKQGTSYVKGQERQRPNRVPRSYVYVAHTTPESEVVGGGAERYVGVIPPGTKMYDFSEDGLGLLTPQWHDTPKGQIYEVPDLDEVEKHLYDNGYHGYTGYNPDIPNAMVLFYPTKVQWSGEWSPPDSKRTPGEKQKEPPQKKYKYKLRKEEGDAIVPAAVPAEGLEVDLPLPTSHWQWKAELIELDKSIRLMSGIGGSPATLRARMGKLLSAYRKTDVGDSTIDLFLASSVRGAYGQELIQTGLSHPDMSAFLASEWALTNHIQQWGAEEQISKLLSHTYGLDSTAAYSVRLATNPNLPKGEYDRRFVSNLKEHLAQGGSPRDVKSSMEDALHAQLNSSRWGDSYPKQEARETLKLYDELFERLGSHTKGGDLGDSDALEAYRVLAMDGDDDAKAKHILSLSDRMRRGIYELRVLPTALGDRLLAKESARNSPGLIQSCSDGARSDYADRMLEELRAPNATFGHRKAELAAVANNTISHITPEIQKKMEARFLRACKAVVQTDQAYEYDYLSDSSNVYAKLSEESGKELDRILSDGSDDHPRLNSVLSCIGSAYNGAFEGLSDKTYSKLWKRMVDKWDLPMPRSSFQDSIFGGSSPATRWAACFDVNRHMAVLTMALRDVTPAKPVALAVCKHVKENAPDMLLKAVGASRLFRYDSPMSEDQHKEMDDIREKALNASADDISSADRHDLRSIHSALGDMWRTSENVSQMKSIFSLVDKIARDPNAKQAKLGAINAITGGTPNLIAGTVPDSEAHSLLEYICESAKTLEATDEPHGRGLWHIAGTIMESRRDYRYDHDLPLGNDDAVLAKYAQYAPNDHRGWRSVKEEWATRNRATPDVLYRKVQFGMNTNKARKLRDMIRDLSPTGEVPPKLLPKWGAALQAGRLPNGNISANKLQNWIDQNNSTHAMNVSYGSWSGGQRHNDLPSNVLHINYTDDHVLKMKEEGVYDTFRSLLKHRSSSHPFTEHSLGWIRWSGNPEDLDGSSSVNLTPSTRAREGGGDPGSIHLEEFQTDIGPDLERKHKGAIVERYQHSLSGLDSWNKGVNQDWPPDAFDVVVGASSKSQPSVLLQTTHRATGKVATVSRTIPYFGYGVNPPKGWETTVRMPKEEYANWANAAIMELASDDLNAFEAKLPSAHLKKINEILYGKHHPGVVGHELFQQWARENGWDGVPVSVPDVPLKAEISGLSATRSTKDPKSGKFSIYPGHFMKVYRQHPQDMGWEPAVYGDIPAQDAEYKQMMVPILDPDTGVVATKPGPGATHNDKIRKCEDFETMWLGVPDVD